MHLYVSLYSLLINNPDKNFKVYILTSSINSDFESKTPFLYKSSNLIGIEYIDVDRSIFEPVSLSMHFTPANFDRLLLGHLLPPELDRVLYLDCDTIIDKPIYDLLNLDIDDYVLAAAVDWDSKASVERIGLPAKSKYFNSGVLLINLKNWRKLGVEIKMLEYMQNNLSKLIYADQDVLNYVLSEKWLEFSPEFNYMEYGHTVMHAEIKHSILHYVGWPKPWYYMSSYPHRHQYWQYLRKTPYRYFREPDKKMRNIFIKYTMLIRRILSSCLKFVKHKLSLITLE